MRRGVFFILVALAGCAGAAWSSNGHKGSLFGVRAGQPVVEVTLNGQGPFAFMVDTGSDRSLMTEATARRLGLALGRSGLATGVFATERVHPVQVQTLEAGGIVANDVTLLAGELPEAAWDGILAHEFLKHFRVTFDYPAHRVTFERPAPPLVPGAAATGSDVSAIAPSTP